MKTAQKRPTNVSLPIALVEEAKRLNINISQACEQGLSDRLAKARADAWLAQNGHCLDASNAYFEEHGLPLAEYRQF